MSYKVCVYAICKNEQTQVDGWVDSMREADALFVTDTGSTDDSAARLRRRGVEVFSEKIEPWRFDEARNRSLAHVPADADICVCTDLDERFLPGWRVRLERAWTPGVTCGRYQLHCDVRPDGTPGLRLVISKAHARHAYVWEYPIHEYLKYVGAEPEKPVLVEGMTLVHYPDRSKSREFYLPLLEAAARENPAGDRMAYYLGREYMYKGRWEDCVRTLTRHLALPSAIWREERSASMRWIAKSCYELGRVAEAYDWYRRAAEEAPHMRDAYVEFAQTADKRGDWATALRMAEAALKITERSDCYTSMGYAWDHTPHDLASIACWQLGLYGRALSHAERALALTPGDARLARNLEIIKRKLTAPTT